MHNFPFFILFDRNKSGLCYVVFKADYYFLKHYLKKNKTPESTLDLLKPRRERAHMELAGCFHKCATQRLILAITLRMSLVGEEAEAPITGENITQQTGG